jgi:hypothetical protein
MSFLKRFRQPYFKRPKIVLSKHIDGPQIVDKKRKKLSVGDYKCRLKGRFLSSNVVVLKCRWTWPIDIIHLLSDSCI